MTATTRRTFVAKYDSGCATCDARIEPGELYFTAPGHEAVSGMDCCGDRPDEDLTVVQRRDSEDDSLTVDAGQVMPRGRTARDACPTCWQVPASSGACGCD